ncbi:MAG: hypothetical protein IH944_08910 [Armatimonadetes bacterium]|nr:hypothetical protein [Armatimonadota bacterium]
MLTTIIAATAFAVPVPSAEWDLKTPYEADKTYEYLVEIDIDDEATGFQALVTLESVMTISKAVDDGFEVQLKWLDMEVEGDYQDDSEFTAELSTSGLITKMEDDEGVDYRSMFVSFMFVYPNKTVSVGDKWSYEEKDDEIKVLLEAVAEETVRGTKTLKVRAKITEGENGMTCTGDYWLTADGELLKYELDLKNWFVPMVGMAFDAKVTAKKA